MISWYSLGIDLTETKLGYLNFYRSRFLVKYAYRFL